MAAQYHLEEFLESDLLVNIVHRTLVPRHEVLPSEEKKLHWKNSKYVHQFHQQINFTLTVHFLWLSERNPCNCISYDSLKFYTD